ncbi:hypothetical protein ACJMK2_032743 [Sinanodonta woodiana]|uniref:NTR domain-containing protein n=1 Tax=Sinanodonta woodiana TaxID=1069815 RepID=A0ABD3X2V5_SINWO
MEWTVVFGQSLLILLVASHVTNACTCSMLSWEEALCPGRGKTVVRATVRSVERLNMEGNVAGTGEYAPMARYQMLLERKFATGSTPLNDNSGIFTMMFPLAGNVCGRSLNPQTDYLIVGIVKEGGILESNMCELILPWKDVNGNIKSILEGEVELTC